jgi:hypothetical protein
MKTEGWSAKLLQAGALMMQKLVLPPLLLLSWQPSFSPSPLAATAELSGCPLRAVQG